MRLLTPEAEWVSRRDRVNVETAAANEADERDAARAREIDGQTRRRGHRRDDRDAREQRLLHDFERRAAADAQDAVVERQALGHQHPADHLVHGVVPSDIFRRRIEPAVRGEQSRRVQPAAQERKIDLFFQ
jgi:hypothetical protein